MRFLIFVVAIFVLGFVLLISACSGETTLQDTFDDLDKPLLSHPDEVSIEFTESVGERDRRLIAMAVDITRPLFEDLGFPLGAEIYVAGDKDSYLRLDQALRGASAEEAAENYISTRGSAQGYYARVLINIPRHDDSYTGARRDATLVFTVVHELYHVLQVRLSEGWNNITAEPYWFGESSANIFAWRAILNAFCKPLNEINVAVASFSQVSTCPKEFVEEKVFDESILAFFAEQTITSTVQLYIVAIFGLDAFDRYYAALPDAAATFTDGVAAAREQLWLRALEKTFAASSLNTINDSAIAYVEEHEEELFQYLAEYLAKYDFTK